MPKSTLAGHPLHPQLITLPMGLLPFSLAMDLLHLGTGRRRYADAADLALKGGLAGALAAGAAGAMDYLEIEPGTNTRRTANLHASMNVAVTGLYGVNLAIRSRRRTPSGRLPTLMSLVGTAALFTSAWYGGHMVYEQGMRVRGVDPIGDAPDAEPPGDERIERAFERAERHVPAGGPHD